MSEVPGQPPDGKGGPHVVVADLDALGLEADDSHHLGRVVRLRDGDDVTAGDGAGAWRRCVFRGDSLEAVGDIVRCESPDPRVGVGFALIKGGRPELVVQKLTELGVDLIVPIACERSVVQWDPAKAEKNHVRLQRVAREAAMQSRQVWLPEVAPLEPFAAAVQRGGVTLGERTGEMPSLARPIVLVGPEGGWAPHELDAAPATVQLGAGVLRAETAAIAAGTLLSALRSGLVVPSSGAK